MKRIAQAISKLTSYIFSDKIVHKSADYLQSLTTNRSKLNQFYLFHTKYKNILNKINLLLTLTINNGFKYYPY